MLFLKREESGGGGRERKEGEKNRKKKEQEKKKKKRINKTYACVIAPVRARVAGIICRSGGTRCRAFTGVVDARGIFHADV